MAGNSRHRARAVENEPLRAPLERRSPERMGAGTFRNRGRSGGSGRRARGWVAQFFRGIKRQYGAVTRDRVDAVWERNRYIVEAVEEGRSRRAVASSVGVHHSTVQRILREAETWLSADMKREALSALWGPHNPPGGQ